MTRAAAIVAFLWHLLLTVVPIVIAISLAAMWSGRRRRRTAPDCFRFERIQRYDPEQRAELRQVSKRHTRLFFMRLGGACSFDGFLVDYSPSGLAMVVAYHELVGDLRWIVCPGQRLLIQSARAMEYWFTVEVVHVRDERDCWRIGCKFEGSIQPVILAAFGGRL